MGKILEVEFDPNLGLQNIFDELMNYKRAGVIARCKYNDVILSNEDEKKLSMQVDRLEKGMDEKEYIQFIEQERKRKKDYQKLQNMLSSQNIVKYYIERAKSLISDKQCMDDWVDTCYSYFSEDKAYFKSIKIASKILVAISKMKKGLDDEAFNLMDIIMNDIPLEDDFYLDIARTLVYSATKDNTLFDQITFKTASDSTKNTYQDSLDNKYKN